MMVFIIEPGYSNMYSEDNCNDFIEGLFKDIDFVEFKKVALELGIKEEVVAEYIECYKNRFDEDADMTITLRKDKDGRMRIRQSASGGEGRDIKEKLRVAFGIMCLKKAIMAGVGLSFISTF